MKSTTETLSPTRVKLTIEVPFDEFQPELDKAYRAIGGQIAVPGFRKGKVPSAIIDQRVGRDTVRSEAINGALNGWYQQAVVDSKVTPLSQPEIDVTKFADGEAIEVTAEVDVVPEFEVPDTSAISVTVGDVDVTDADVDEQLEALRTRFATQSSVERPAAEGDFVTIALSAAQKDGTPIDQASVTNMPYVVGREQMLDGLDEAVTGLSAGESTTFATTLVGGEFKGSEVDVALTVNEVKATELPEIDEDFVAMVSDFDTVEELRADLVDRLTRGKRMQQAAEARDLVMEELISRIEMPLPDGLIEAEISARKASIMEQLMQAGATMDQYLADEGQTAEEFDAELERTTRDQVVGQFVLDKVVRDAEIGLEGDELSQHIMRRAQESGQDPNQYVAHMLEHNHVPELVGEIVRGKAMASLVEAASVTDKSGNVIDLAALRADGRTEDEDADEAAGDSGSDDE